MIQTKGFTIDNYPRFTPADPSLVAFQPQKIAEGINQAFSLQDYYNRIRAFKAGEDEKAATRDARIKAAAATLAAETAQATASLPNFEPKALYERDQLKALSSLLPKKTAAEEAGYRSTIDLTPDIVKTKKLQLEQDRLNAAPLGAAARATAKAQAAEAGNAVATAPFQRIASLQALSDKIQNATSDADIARELKVAETNLKKSEAQKEAAMAGYYERGGASKAPVSPDKAAKIVVDSLDKLDGLTVSDGRTFAKYLKDTRDANGNLKTPSMAVGGFGGFGGAKLDPVGELFFKQYQQFQQELAHYQGLIHGGPAALGTSATVAPPPKSNRLRFSSDANGSVSLTPVQ